MFRTVKDMLFATTKTNRQDWVSALPIVEMGLRATIHARTKLSPYQVVFGRPMRVPLSWATAVGATQLPLATGENTPRQYSQFVMDLQAQLMETWTMIGRLKDRGNEVKPRNAVPLTVGATVMARILPAVTGVTAARYDGPYRVTGCLGRWTYELTHIATGRKVHRNWHHVKVCPEEFTSIQTPAQTMASPKNTEGMHCALKPLPPLRRRVPPSRYGFPPRN